MAEDDTERALREAADWLARLNGRHVDQQTLDEFFGWRRRPGNADAYAKVENLWTTSERLGGDRDVASIVQDALARPRWQNKLISLEGSIRRRPRAISIAAMCLMAVTIGIGILLLQGTTYSTGVGEQRLVRLADGSSIHLDTATNVKVKLTQNLRRVYLTSGQALFSVAHDTTRPFVVYAGDAEIKAVGTEFDVENVADRSVSVVLIHGRLALSAHASEDLPIALDEGRGATFSTDGWSQPQSIDANAALSWTTGRLRFSNTPLAEAVAAMNRYATRKIVLADPALGAIQVNGTFNTDDINGFLDAVTTLNQLRATNQTDATTSLSR